MSRPSKHEKRERQLNIKFTLREFAWIVHRAATEQLRVVEFGRAQILVERPLRRGTMSASPDTDPALLLQASRIGNNLNQIARKLHQLDAPAPADLAPALAELRELIRKASADGA